MIDFDNKLNEFHRQLVCVEVYSRIPGILHDVYCQGFFNVKVGQWVYIDDYFRKLVGVVEEDL